MVIRKLQLPSHAVPIVVTSLQQLSMTELDALVVDLESLNQGDKSLELLIEAEAGTSKEHLIQALVQFNRHQAALYDQPLSVKEYIQQVVVQVGDAFSQDRLEWNDEKRSILTQLLKAALSPEVGLGFILKISDLRTYHHNNFSRVQIVSDIRPVFPSDEEVAEPNAALITHTLRMSYQIQTGETRDIFIGLDTEELYEIRNCVLRAIDKTRMLELFLGRAGLVTPATDLEV